MRRRLPAVLLFLLLLPSCRTDDGPARLPSDRWGIDVLVRDTAPDGSTWVGTNGDGLFALRAGVWEHVVPEGAFHALAWQGDTLWAGTAGDGWWRTTDAGLSWQRWSEPNPYVTPNGIVRRGDTVYVGTANGIHLTWDGGRTWRHITDQRDGFGRIGNAQVFALAAVGSRFYVSHAHGVEVSTDGGRTWQFIAAQEDSLTKTRQFVALGTGADRIVRFVGTPRPHGRPELRWARPGSGESPGPPQHDWFPRPIPARHQPYVNPQRPFGVGGRTAAMFLNAPGAPVVAIAGGVVTHAEDDPVRGHAVVVRHDQPLVVGDSQFTVYSVYAHNAALRTARGRRVAAGDTIARVGRSGAADHAHLGLSVHLVPRGAGDSVSLTAATATNPELWLAPLGYTGMLAGTVVDRDGRPVPGLRIYGLDKPIPPETPFAHITTYGEGTPGSPVYGEHFVVNDVPPGEYLLGTEIDGRSVFRIVVIEPGRLTWVRFAP